MYTYKYFSTDWTYVFILCIIQIADLVERQSWTRQDLTVSEPSTKETMQIGNILVNIYLTLNTIFFIT